MNSIRRLFYKNPKVPKEYDSLFSYFFFASQEVDMCTRLMEDAETIHITELFSIMLYHLRSVQSKVLVLALAIMDKFLPADQRAHRDYRIKFPEEVLQDGNIGGHLWFGAEVLAESEMGGHLEGLQDRKELQNKAREFLRSLQVIRSCIKDHCQQLRKEITPSLRRSLVWFDQVYAEFEFMFISYKTKVKSTEEFYYLQDVGVLFSETLERALSKGLVSHDQVEDCDPSLMFTIPRLGIFCGLAVFPDGPLSISRLKDHQVNLFQKYTRSLCRLRAMLHQLSQPELEELERILATSGESCSSDSPRDSEEPSQRKSLNLHKLFVQISAIADQLQTDHAEDLRLVLKWVFDMSKGSPASEEEACSPADLDWLSVDSAEEALPSSPSFQAPTWVPNEQCPSCTNCQSSFSFFLRRHHCRCCGKIFCYKCSNNFLPLPPTYIPVRVCIPCAENVLQC